MDDGSKIRGALTTRRTVLGGLAATALLPSRASAAPAIRVAMFDDGAPIGYLDGAGAPAGMIVDGVNLVAVELGWQVSYRALPWARAQEFVRTGDADALCTLPTDKRRAFTLFARQPLLTMTSSVLHFRADNPRAGELRGIATLDQLRGFSIAVIIGNTWPNALFDGWPRLDPMRNNRSAVRAVAAGRADLLVTSREVARFHERQLGVPALESRDVGFLPGGVVPYHFGLRRELRGGETLIAAFDTAQAALAARGAIEAVLDRYRAPASSS
jgi:polar amino acid transport system substrate-binding protein